MNFEPILSDSKQLWDEARRWSQFTHCPLPGESYRILKWKKNCMGFEKWSLKVGCPINWPKKSHSIRILLKLVPIKGILGQIFYICVYFLVFTVFKFLWHILGFFFQTTPKIWDGQGAQGVINEFTWFIRYERFGRSGKQVIVIVWNRIRFLVTSVLYKRSNTCTWIHFTHRWIWRRSSKWIGVLRESEYVCCVWPT